MHLPPSQALLLEENLDLLNSLGFHLESFGPNVFMIRSIPAISANINPEMTLRAVMDDLEAGESPMYKSIEEKIITRVCKSAAIKAGQTLSRTRNGSFGAAVRSQPEPFYLPAWPTDVNPPFSDSISPPIRPDLSEGSPKDKTKTSLLGVGGKRWYWLPAN